MDALSSWILLGSGSFPNRRIIILVTSFWCTLRLFHFTSPQTYTGTLHHELRKVQLKYNMTQQKSTEILIGNCSIWQGHVAGRNPLDSFGFNKHNAIGEGSIKFFLHCVQKEQEMET
jgi:hypothetical protein